ncbi:hypothetical protein HYU08_00400 [Candidatus Woesearchaeota archaeon]|nr:hypothetical protein [Candidatus Woesearchaeota archaeon]
MSKKKSEQEIEEAQQKFRGEDKKKETPDKKQEKTEEPQKEKAKETKTVEDAFLETEDDAPKKPREIIDLETITRKAPAPPAEARDDYVEQLKNRPVTEIYNEIKDIYRAVEEKGYLSPTEQRRVEYSNTEIERRFEDENYSFTEETARAASISHRLSASMMGMYKGKKDNDMYKH